MKKVFSLLLSLLMLFTLATGCASNKKGDGASKEAATALSESTVNKENTKEVTEKKKEENISFATWDYGERKDMNDAIIKAFKEKLSINLEIVNYPTEQYATMIQTKAAAGDAPDLINVHGSGSGYGKVLVANKELLPIDGEPWLKNYSADFIEGCKSVVDGKLYCVDVTIHVLGGIYKKQLFKELGIVVPECYEDFIDVCEKLKAKGIIPLMGGFKESWTTQMLTHQSINQCLGEVGKTSQVFEKAEMKFSDPVYKKALAYFDEFVKKGYYGPQPLGTDAATASKLIAQGKAGILVQGNWQLADIRKTDPDGEYGFFTIPFNKKGQQKFISVSMKPTGSGGIAIYAKGKKIDAAKMALNLYHSDSDLQNIIVKEMGGVSTNKIVKVDDKFLNEVIAAFNSGKPMPFPDGYNSQPVNDAYTRGLQGIAAGVETIESVTARMDELKKKELEQQQ